MFATEITLRVNGKLCSFSPEDKLGMGSKGTVIAGKDNDYIARVLESKDFKKDVLQQNIRHLSSLIPHHSLLKTVDIIFEDGQCYIISERAKGENLSRCLNDRRFPDIHFAIIYQLMEAVNHLHLYNQVHGNLSPADIFVEFQDDGSVHVQIADAGLVAALSTAALDKKQTKFVNMDAFKYLAPEVFKGTEKVHGERWKRKESDVFSLGKVVEEMAKHKMLGMQGMCQSLEPHTVIMNEVLYYFYHAIPIPLSQLR